MCSQWPVAERLLSEVSTAKSVSVLLWRQLLLNSAIQTEGCPPSDDTCTASSNKGRSNIADLLPEAVRGVLEDELWAELAVHFDTGSILLQLTASTMLCHALYTRKVLSACGKNPLEYRFFSSREWRGWHHQHQSHGGKWAEQHGQGPAGQEGCGCCLEDTSGASRCRLESPLLDQVVHAL